MLTITYAMKRKRGGEWATCEPSRFILELPQDDIRWLGKPGAKTQTISKTEGQNKLANLKAMLKPGG